MSSFKNVFASLLLASGFSAGAADFQLGVQGGAIGHIEDKQGLGADASIGYGAYFMANPFGNAALKVDATLANFEGASYTAGGPSLYFFLMDYSELRAGVGGGAAFHKFEHLDLGFGMNLGLLGEVSLSDSLKLGLETRYHWVLNNTPNVWSTFLSLGYAFGDGGW